MLLSNTAAVLNGIEYLVNKVFRTGKDEEIATIILDSENYRQLREAELKLLAQIASQKVIAQRHELILQPMTPRERRIVHLALAPIEGVRSQSDGEGENRKITIYPAE
jgi:spoIIIJ-associated protein